MSVPPRKRSSAGSGGGELEHAMIEERRARLEAVRHAREVHLHEDVLGQIRHHLGEADPVEDFASGLGLVHPRADAAALRLREEAAHRLRVEPALLGIREDADHPRVARPEVGVGHAVEAVDVAREAGRQEAAQRRRGAEQRANAGDLRDPEPGAQAVDPLVAVVADEALVAAVAGQRHRHELPRLAREEVRRQRAGIGVGLLVEARELREERDVLRAHHELVVRRPVALRHLPRVGQLVVLLVLEADREGLDRPGRGLGHAGDDDARIDPAGEERAERHVRDHPADDRLADGRAQRLEPLRHASARASRGSRASSSARCACARPPTPGGVPGGSFWMPRRPVPGDGT